MGFGATLGFINAFLVGALAGIVTWDAHLGALVMIVGSMFGLVVGGVSGLLASVAAKAPFLVRYPLIVALPALVIALLGEIDNGPRWHVALFSLPTVLLCFQLERATRAPRTTDAEPVPQARVA